MPPGAGKRLLRCSIPATLHATLVAEANARHIDLGALLEGRLAAAGGGPEALAMVMLGHRLDAIAQRQEAMLEVIERLVAAVTSTQSTADEADESPAPIATYEQLYGKQVTPATAPEIPTGSEPRKRWPFWGGSNG